MTKDENMDNQTSVSDFLLLEFSKIREFQILHFLLFLIVYMTVVTGNLLIISAVASDYRLHTPMYFFLMNLAIFDIGSVSVTVPKSMINSLLNTRYISYAGCVAQVLFFLFFGGSDFFLLSVMAYDRYVAICIPLKYEMIMNKRACMQMITGVWIFGLFYGLLHTSGTFSATFCSKSVHQFFCEIPQLLKLYCSKAYQAELIVLVISILGGLGCLVFTIATYVMILMAVLRIPSEQGRKKAFSTCLPHLIVFCTLVFTSSIAHLSSAFNTPPYMDFILTIMYSVVPPMLNPFIYSMRNKDIKVALSKVLGVR